MTTRQSKKQPSVLVTGGGGYIGSVLCRMLLDAGYRVRVFDRLFYGKAPVQPLLRNKNFELVVGDMRQIRAHTDLLDGMDSIVHLAALSNDPTCDLDPAKTKEVNFTGVARLAEWAKRRGIRRFVFASSCSVYGMGRNSLCTEQSTLNPVSLYAETMVNSERMLTDLADGNFQPVRLRQATVFGLSPRMRFDLAINVMTLHAVRKKKIFVLGGGNQWRPFVHVADTARVFQLCLEKPPALVGNRVFNVGGNDLNYRILDLAEQVRKWVPGTEIEMIPDNADLRSYRVGFDLIEEVLGFKPRLGVSDGIQEIAREIRKKRGTDFADNRYYNIKRVKELETILSKRGGEPLCSPVDLRPFSVSEEDQQSLVRLLNGGKDQAFLQIDEYMDRLRSVLGLPYVLPVEGREALADLVLDSIGDVGKKELVLTPFVPPFLVRKMVQRKLPLQFLDLHQGELRLNEKGLRGVSRKEPAGIFLSHFFGTGSVPKSCRSLLKKVQCPVIEDMSNRMGPTLPFAKLGKNQQVIALWTHEDPLQPDSGNVLATNSVEVYAKWLVSSIKRAGGLSSSVHYVSPADRRLGNGMFLPVDPRRAFFDRMKLQDRVRLQAHRQSIFSLIRDQLAACESIQVPENSKTNGSSLYQFLPLLLSEMFPVEQFVDYLRHENVDVRSVRGFYGKPLMERLNLEVPNAVDLIRRGVIIPLYDQLTPRDAHNIALSVRKVVDWMARESEAQSRKRKFGL